MNRMTIATLSLLLVASACASSDSTDTAPAPTTSSQSDTTSTGRAADPPSGESLTLAVGDLAPGEYTFDELGTQVTLTTDSPLFAPVAQPSVVILEDPEGPGESSDARALLLLRPTGLLSSGDIRGGYADVTGPTRDIDAWIDVVGFEVEDRSVIDVASLPTEVLTGSMPFGDDTFLRTNAPVPFNGTPDGDYIYVRAAHVYRIWLIDQGDFDPVVVMAIADPDDRGWFDTTQAVVESLSLGEPAPHPNPPEPGGCIQGGADLTGEVVFDAAVDLRIMAENEPFDGGTGFGLSPRAEIYRAGSGTIGMLVLGPLDPSPDFVDADSALATLVRGRPVTAQPELEAFGSLAVGAVIEPADGSGVNTSTVTASGDDDSVSPGSAVWFFDTPHGLWMINAFGFSDLDASIEFAHNLAPSFELVPDECGGL